MISTGCTIQKKKRVYFAGDSALATGQETQGIYPLEEYLSKYRIEHASVPLYDLETGHRVLLSTPNWLLLAETVAALSVMIFPDLPTGPAMHATKQRCMNISLNYALRD